MRPKGWGINLAKSEGDYRRFEEQLRCFENLGYDYVEIPVEAVDVVYNGRINRRRMEELKRIVRDFDLKYTAHSPSTLDPRDLEDLDLQKDLFKSSIEFTAEIGGEILVCHYEKDSGDERVEESFLKTHLEMSEFAQGHKVKLCVENIEIEVVSKVVDFLRKVNRDNVRMTYDTGHGYLAAKYFGFDFLESIKISKPFIEHIHVNDSFGRFEKMRLENFELYKLKSLSERHTLGRGDLHLPPGWGKINFKKVFEILDDYKGIFMLEYYNHRYRPFNKEILEETKELLKKLG